MSDLQCAATLLVAGLGEGDDLRKLAASLRDRNLAMVYADATPGAVRAAETVAGGLGTQTRALDRSGPGHARSSDEVTTALEEIADLHRGETVLVLGDGAVLGEVVARLIGHTRHDPVWDGRDVVEVAADADGWSVRTPTDPGST